MALAVPIPFALGRFRQLPSTTLKIALFAPIPSARVSTTMAVNPGALSNDLAA